MSETVFAADPTRLLIAAAAGIVLLLLLIIKFKFHPVLSLLISALLIGLGAGMPVPTLVNTVEKGAGETLQGIVLLIGLGSLFGGILEVSGGAQCVAQTLVNRFGEKKAGIALGITGLVVGTIVFFEAGVVILIPLAFGLAKKTKKSTLYYVIPLLAGLATGFAFIPPSAGSVLVANMLGVDRSWCADRNFITYFCRNFMVKIYRDQDPYRTSNYSFRSKGRGRSKSFQIFNCHCDHPCSAGTHSVQHTFGIYSGT